MKSIVFALALVSAPVLALAVPAQPAKPAVTFVSQITNDEGEVLLTDQFQRTLYVFDRDMGQAQSVCTGGCAETWPPYIVDAQEAAALTAPLGTLARGNGLQLTYAGRPVYTFAFDRMIGDDHGDGLGGVWHYIEIQ